MRFTAEPTGAEGTLVWLSIKGGTGRLRTAWLDRVNDGASDFELPPWAASGPNGRRSTGLKLERVLALLGLAVPLFAQYGGPALLTRGEAPSAMSAPEIKFRPFAEICGVWDAGLAGVQVTDTGQLANNSSFGLSLAWGVSGTHSWRRTKLGLDYRGSVDHYFNQTAFDSINQGILLGITHQLRRRVILSLSESAGMFTRDFGLVGLPQTVPFDPSTTNTPTTDFFDNRTIYMSTSASLAIQRTARLSFAFGGMGFITRRRSSALYGVVGAGANADVQYRFSRRTTIGAQYAYQHYDYTRILGNTDVHSAALSFAMQITRLLEFTGFAGAMRGETRFVETVPLDPAIAALLGVTSTSLVGHQVLWAPNFSARLSRTFHTGVGYVGVGHAMTPGNGLFLTSEATDAVAGYSYTGIRRWSFAASVNYNRARAIGHIQGLYSTVSGSVSASRQIMRSVHFTANYSARQYNSPDFTNYNRLIHSVRVGVGFSPGDVPLRIW